MPMTGMANNSHPFLAQEQEELSTTPPTVPKVTPAKVKNEHDFQSRSCLTYCINYMPTVTTQRYHQKDNVVVISL
ncbi:hypothetical protein NQ317_012921 [Molorchus minor]|uniref:Uncharacterized protein n=1 Tax=Molorchus minor TaxID=1323400 RepID=A0ABQ9JJF0_9CUCU|nr:hypothetical protein NQ317_012921 [Molorchus minor]